MCFAVPNGLPLEPGRNHLAVHTEDHPLEYLEFHGEIPKGNYGAGTMEVFDRGTYETLKWTDRKIEVHLHGERVDARYALFPLDKGDDAKDWMIHRMDPPADPSAEPMPEVLVPMLARSGVLPRDDAAWGFEIKWDGVRAICHSEPGTLRLHSRNGNEITRRYPELARLNRALHHHRAILDGEIVAFGPDGKPSFAALQRRMHLGDERRARRLADEAPVTYVIFDLLWLDGHPLMERPYAERRAALAELGLDGPRWQAPDHVVGHGAEVLAAAREQGLEGVVAKRLDSGYEPGRRSAAWVKVKLFEREELVVCGWLPGEGRRRDRIGALLLGVHELDPEPGLRYAGRVGTGFTEDELDRLAGLLGPLEQPAAPFDLPGPKPPREAVWVRPELVCDVEFAEWTPDGQLRHPSYKGLRETTLVVQPDRTRKNGALGEIEGRRIKLSNLDKVLYPAAGFTKRDVIDYHVAVAPVLLPHLAGRALTLKRYPSGVDGDFFYEKNAPSHRPEWVSTARVGDIDYVVVEEVATLVWLANLADLELHTSLGRVDDLDHPTTLAFDLDPGSPAGLLECCRVALWLRGHVRRARPGELRQDLRVQGDAGLPAARRRGHVVADQGVLQGGGRAARAGGARARRVAADEGHPQGQGPGRLEPERRAQDHRQRLLAARPRAPDGLHAAELGGGARGSRGGRRRAPAVHGPGGAGPRRAPRRPVRAGAGRPPSATGAVGLRSGAQGLQDAERLLGLRAHEGEGARGVVHVLEGHLVALDAEAGDPTDGGPLVALGLAVAQQDADLQGVVEPDGGQLGGGRADQREVAGGEGATEAGVGRAGG